MTLKVDQGHWERQHSRFQIIFCSKHVSISHRFLSYSTSNNGVRCVPLKSGFGIIRGHWKRHHSSSMVHCYGFNVPVKGSIDEGYGCLLARQKSSTTCSMFMDATSKPPPQAKISREEVFFTTQATYATLRVHNRTKFWHASFSVRQLLSAVHCCCFVATEWRLKACLHCAGCAGNITKFYYFTSLTVKNSVCVNGAYSLDERDSRATRCYGLYFMTWRRGRTRGRDERSVR